MEELVQDTYWTCYQGNESMPTADVTTDAVSTHTIVGVILTMFLQVPEDDFATFTNISVTNHIRYLSSELDEYLWKPAENTKQPLKWWIANWHTYPHLHHMALDYLSIPGESLSISFDY